ncbi:SDR family NAD(P)-dependent oxidoreductase [Pseudoalteromonas sp. JC28]|uniref:SDR family NAD(P)-dependent oxidoreductase n=1 Tax=Pseudoalteromonas sp. JC28 TaxID=2267617 RepID=UPI001571BF82|nr:SDR family oxidoreductase [Pseudoalteromonas sp. JC28]NSY35200.1 SDR family NAD(P)-dependent oxidoreductase [Pseudoalteromonas sp. JC28]
MSKKYVLVTGSAGGIGQALTNKFIAEGFIVLGVDQCKQLASDKLIPLQIDLSKIVNDPTYLNEFINSVVHLTQEDGISYLINNAAEQILNSIENITIEEWMRSFDINLHAPFILIKVFYENLVKNNGAVVNISSIHARLTKKEFSAYATSKAALSALTRNLALDFGGKVRINAIEPAAIATKMLQAGFEGKLEEFSKLESFHPQGRIGLPEEVASLAYYLTTNESRFLHGSCISIDGGISSCLSDPS